MHNKEIVLFDPESGVIDSFRGKYAPFSNFYERPIIVGSRIFPTNEHAFQALKAVSEKERDFVQNAPSPGGKDGAKYRGRTVKMRKGWDEPDSGLRDDIMSLIVTIKFTMHQDLATLLKDTYPKKLVEGNTWGDTYWGVCRGKGENRLGHILMELRKTLLEYDLLNV